MEADIVVAAAEAVERVQAADGVVAFEEADTLVEVCEADTGGEAAHAGADDDGVVHEGWLRVEGRELRGMHSNRNPPLAPP